MNELGRVIAKNALKAVASSLLIGAIAALGVGLMAVAKDIGSITKDSSTVSKSISKYSDEQSSGALLFICHPSKDIPRSLDCNVRFSDMKGPPIEPTPLLSDKTAI